MPDRNKVLYIEPIYDDFAIMYAIHTEQIEQAARKLGYDVISVKDADAIPRRIYEIIAREDPYWIFSVGHGCENITTVYKRKDLFWVGSCGDHIHHDKNIYMLKGRAVYLLSCSCGVNLVPEIVMAGAEMSAGYRDDFWWVVDPEKPPEEDPYAKGFFDAANTFMISLLAGKTPTDAAMDAKARFNYWIDYWKKWLEEHPDASPKDRARALLAIRLLEHDRDILVTYGYVKALPQLSLLIAAIPFGLAFLSKEIFTKK